MVLSVVTTRSLLLVLFAAMTRSNGMALSFMVTRFFAMAL